MMNAPQLNSLSPTLVTLDFKIKTVSPYDSSFQILSTSEKFELLLGGCSVWEHSENNTWNSSI